MPASSWRVRKNVRSRKSRNDKEKKKNKKNTKKIRRKESRDTATFSFVKLQVADENRSARFYGRIREVEY